MSVSDPLIKKLKAFVLEFRTVDTDKPVTDQHRCLQVFCDTLEAIFRKGIKHTTSLFGVNKRDYWSWVSSLEKHNNGTRVNPVLSLVIDNVKKTKKVQTAQGRGRLFIRQALQRKVLTKCLEYLMTSVDNLEHWYDHEESILGNEILCEILMSLLYPLNEVNFCLDVKNSSFLDETWRIPTYINHQVVPCISIGIQVQSVDGRLLVVAMEPGSVAEDDGVLEVGDVIDEVLGLETRRVNTQQVVHMLKQNRGAPIELGIVKCKMPDHSLFPPVMSLLHKGGRDYNSLQRVLDEEEEKKKRKENGVPPPHAVLPEDELEQVPVHSEMDQAIYHVKYVGKVPVGEFGGVQQVEHVVLQVLQAHSPEENLNQLQNVILELGETQVIVTDAQSKQEVLRNSYTEVSSCGRRIDHVLYFCYIIGETTCTLSKDFVAHVFRANHDAESKTILCAIAQGFDRTHWFV